MAEQRQELQKNSHNIFQCDYYRDWLFLFFLSLSLIQRHRIEYSDWSTIITIIMIINYSAGYGWQSTREQLNKNRRIMNGHLSTCLPATYRDYYYICSPSYTYASCSSTSAPNQLTTIIAQLWREQRRRRRRGRIIPRDKLLHACLIHKLDLSYSFSTLQKYQFADHQQSQHWRLIINYSVFIQLLAAVSF